MGKRKSLHWALGSSFLPEHPTETGQKTWARYLWTAHFQFARIFLSKFMSFWPGLLLIQSKYRKHKYFRRNNWVFPVIYGLLSTKSQTTYERFWQLVREQWPKFSPQSVSIDYEQGAINAIRAVFPQVDLRGCLFHLVQNMKKRVAEANLTQVLIKYVVFF